jgi:lactate permease
VGRNQIAGLPQNPKLDAARRRRFVLFHHCRQQGEKKRLGNGFVPAKMAVREFRRYDAVSWTMNVNPLGNLALSALVALVPILFLFIALTVLKLKGHWAAIIATSLAVGVACIAFGMPMQYGGLSVVYGALFGLFPVSWIVITALFIYNMSVKTGQFEVVKNSLATISDDRRMQALLIAFSFGAFIEGAAGFGTPVAIIAAMLAGLSFNPLYAASLCLLANTAPVAFGAIGIPIVVGANAASVDFMGFSQMVGRTLPFLSVFVPLYLVILMAGQRQFMKALESRAFGKDQAHSLAMVIFG